MSILIYESELYHHGVKGMKWGVRRSRNMNVVPRSSGSRYSGQRNNMSRRANSSSNNSSRESIVHQRRKRALKIGAAVVGTALAAYGVYKVSSIVKDKRSAAAMKKAADYIDNNFMVKIGSSKLANGKIITEYSNIRGDGSRRSTFEGLRNKSIGKYNSDVISKGRDIYRNATNTRLDRGLNRIVDAGNAVGRFKNNTGEAAIRFKNKSKEAIKTTTKSAYNKILDTVNPVYENVPESSRTNIKNINGLKITENVTTYRRKKRRR